MTEVECKQKVIIVSNPDEAMALIVEDGKVVKATCADYIGMDELSARCAATSVMRYVIGTEPHPETGQSDGYPQSIGVRPTGLGVVA